VRWHHGVTQCFWAHLDDEQAARLRERMLAQFMRLAATRAANAKGKRFGFRRNLQVMKLFATSQATYISELSDALELIADTLSLESRDWVSWSEFQRRWQSVSARYRRYFLSIQSNGRIAVESLRTPQGLPEKYLLTFDLWNGAQRVFNAPQIVFQINIPALVDSWKSGNNTQKEVVKMMGRAASRQSHPVTKTTVGWLRVHVDDGYRLCFVDEVQSDLL